jgi:hypothetical protein
MYFLTKTLEPSRSLIGNDGWESSDTDLLAIHHYDTQLQQLVHRYGPEVKLSDLFERKRPGGRILTLDNFPHQGQSIILTEFGGIAYAPATQPEAHKAWGYQRCWNISELEMKYAGLLETVNNIELFSGFRYT